MCYGGSRFFHQALLLCGNREHLLELPAGVWQVAVHCSPGGGVYELAHLPPFTGSRSSRASTGSRAYTGSFPGLRAYTGSFPGLRAYTGSFIAKGL